MSHTPYDDAIDLNDDADSPLMGDAEAKQAGRIRRAIAALTPSKRTAAIMLILALIAAGAAAAVFFTPAALAFVASTLATAAALTISGVAPLAFLTGLSAVSMSIIAGLAAAAAVLAAGVTLVTSFKLASGFVGLFRGKAAVSAPEGSEEVADASEEVLDDAEEKANTVTMSITNILAELAGNKLLPQVAKKDGTLKDIKLGRISASVDLETEIDITGATEAADLIPCLSKSDVTLFRNFKNKDTAPAALNFTK